MSNIDSSTMIVTTPDIDMRSAIELKYRTQNPILLMENNQLVGVLSDQEIYSALLGNYQTEEAA